MKVAVVQSISNVEDWEELKRFAAQAIERLTDAVNGKLTFGDNLQVTLTSATFGGSGQTVSVGHNLGRVPAGYIITSLSANIQVFNGATGNTADKIYLQASGAGTAGLLIF